ncbi:glycosyltransferase [Gordonia sp. KTR9]|uniref:glycosyltransferase n=1 Tax=Gordonia sp. KTR9 TaxID=337191 RepID=UPI00027DD8ED|nr:nucleotide disphospho-sugar-binding domain-containing protein [Gordonia sp. KTR9]AFR48469.1 UDP-glucuronosyltransferase like transferase [Gordonia sp. KTR9]
MTAHHVSIVLYGSRGDIQPGICLALELLMRGHRVSVLVPPNLAGLARATGVGDVHEIGLDSDAAWSSDDARSARGHRNPLTRAAFALRTVRAGFDALDTDLERLFVPETAPLHDADLLVAAPLCQDRVVAVAERLDIPPAVLRFGPMSENGLIGAVPGLTERWSPAWKRRSWRIADQLTWIATGWNENRFRRRIGLPPSRRPLPRRLGADRIQQIQAYDPEMVPGLAAEWDDRKPLVGFFDLPAASRAGIGEIGADATGLARWLDAGEPPVFLTFGSMPILEPKTVIARWRAAARAHGVRCLIAMGDATGIDPDDPDVFHTAGVDHASVLPRCVAAVHHGGAGTTAASLRAGLPTLVCAVTADQPFWGERVRALRVGAAVRLSTFTDDDAHAGLATVLAAETRSAAAAFARRMTSPDKAVAAAADICESRLR